MRIVVLDGFTLDQGDAEVWRGLESLGEVRVHARTRPEERAERCRGAAIVLTNKVAVDAALMDATPGLKYIGVLATGTNIVDLEAARARGIVVTNVPGYSTDSVAQLVFALILHFTHDVAGHARDVQAGRWAASEDFCFLRQPLVELKGKTLVVVGSGAIGSAVTRIALAFGMQTIAAQVPGSPSSPASITSPSAPSMTQPSLQKTRTPLEAALPQADFVTLHCPLTEATRGLVDAKFLALLKPGAILINTGRGPLLSQDDLIRSLAFGRLGGVGLDVLAQEPPPADHPLLDPKAPWARKVVVTPHLGWATVEARRRLLEKVLTNLRAFLDGKDLNRVA